MTHIHKMRLIFIIFVLLYKELLLSLTGRSLWADSSCLRPLTIFSHAGKKPPQKHKKWCNALHQLSGLVLTQHPATELRFALRGIDLKTIESQHWSFLSASPGWLLLFNPEGLIAYLGTKISLYIDRHGFISNPHWLERLLMSPVWLTMVQSASLNVKNTSFVTKSHCRPKKKHKTVPNLSLQSSRKHFFYPTDSCHYISSPWVHFLRPICSTLQSHHTLLC